MLILHAIALQTVETDMITKKVMAATGILMGLVIVGSPVMANAKQTLTGSHIRKIFPGSYTLVIYGFDVRVNASKAGALAITLFGDKLKGNWSVKDNKLCIALSDGNEKASQCSAVTYDGKKWYKAGGLSFYGK